jgi:hypothetical protein
MFTEKDLQLFAQKGIEQSQVLNQVERFEKGFPFANLAAAATINNGIIKFDQLKVSSLIDFYNQASSDLEVLKFVPASGAASRMFKDLFEYRSSFDGEIDNENKIDKSEFKAAKLFFEQINQFAFYQSLCDTLKADGLDLNTLLAENKRGLVLDYFLLEKGLNYAKLPKALLLFHPYEDGSRLAMEEHLVEGAHYVNNNKDEVQIHFTVSSEHRGMFDVTLNAKTPKYAEQFGVSYEISFSEQKPATDTVAVDMDNKPFRETDGSLLFRPGGHGALIENLNDLSADVVFVKNIDNVVPDRLRKPTYDYKKVIGAHLLKLQNKAFNYLEMLDKASFSEEDMLDIIAFVQNDLMITLNEDFDHLNAMEKLDYLFAKLNRPMRVCGMVKNEGEPGGGPFWVNANGEKSLQIVEASQIDLSDNSQKQILDKATHFNPVDLVCSLRNYKGDDFDLLQYVDDDTGFISHKSKNGRKLKAIELPGLWNGAMADWITIFVEVPIDTFNPVKTVNDLLRPQHSRVYI